jgi:hypothetical protein
MHYVESTKIGGNEQKYFHSSWKIAELNKLIFNEMRSALY